MRERNLPLFRITDWVPGVEHLRPSEMATDKYSLYYVERSRIDTYEGGMKGDTLQIMRILIRRRQWAVIPSLGGHLHFVFTPFFYHWIEKRGCFNLIGLVGHPFLVTYHTNVSPRTGH